MTDTPVVTFVWDDRGLRTGVVRMEWKPGHTLKRYLHTQPLRREGLLAKWKTSRVVDQHRKKLQLIHVPKQDDVIVFQRVGKR